MQEDVDALKLTSPNLLLKRLLNTSKTGGDQSGSTTATPTSASQSRLSEVWHTVLLLSFHSVLNFYSWQLFFIVKEKVRSEVFPNNIMSLVGMFVFVVCLSVCRILPIGLRGHSYSNRLLLWDWCHDMLDLQIINWNLVIRVLTSFVWHCVHMWNSVFIHCPNLVVLVDFWGQFMSYSTYGSRFLPDF